MRRIWSVLLPLALAACSDDAVGPVRELALQVQAAESIQESAVVESVPGAAMVRGVYTAASSGYTLRAHYRAGGGEVTVSIAGRRPEAAWAVITGLEYRATVPLPPGTHTVRVVHLDPSLASHGTRDVARQQVRVPGGR